MAGGVRFVERTAGAERGDYVSVDRRISGGGAFSGDTGDVTGSDPGHGWHYAGGGYQVRAAYRQRIARRRHRTAAGGSGSGDPGDSGDSPFPGGDSPGPAWNSAAQRAVFQTFGA